jgi:hypothetical protein
VSGGTDCQFCVILLVVLKVYFHTCFSEDFHGPAYVVAGVCEHVLFIVLFACRVAFMLLLLV